MGWLLTVMGEDQPGESKKKGSKSLGCIRYSIWSCIDSLIVLAIGHSVCTSVLVWIISGKALGCQGSGEIGEWIELDTAPGGIQLLGYSSKLYRGVRRLSLSSKSDQGSGNNSEKFWIPMRSRIFGVIFCSMVVGSGLEMTPGRSFSEEW